MNDTENCRGEEKNLFKSLHRRFKKEGTAIDGKLMIKV